MNCILKLSITAAMALASSTALASELWDNGDADGANMAHSSGYKYLDDFQVPPGGWWVDTFRTQGIWALVEDEPSNILLSVFAADPMTGLPDHTCDISLNVLDWTQLLTGNSWSGIDEVEITVDCEAFYLPWGTYWLEMDIDGVKVGTKFHQTSRQEITGLSAMADGLIFLNRDMCFQLYGDDVNFQFWTPDELTIPWEEAHPFALPSSIRTSNNDHYLVYLPKPSGPMQAAQWSIQFSTPVQLPVGGLDRMALVFEMSTLGTEPVCCVFEAFDRRNQRWVSLGRAATPRRDAAMSFAFARPEDFFTPTEKLELRVRMIPGIGRNPLGLRIDHVYWSGLHSRR